MRLFLWFSNTVSSYAVSLVPLLSVARIRMKSTSAKAMSKCSRFTKSRSALIHESSWIRTENVCFSAEKSLISGICMTRISFPWKSSICKKNKGKHVRLQSDSTKRLSKWAASIKGQSLSRISCHSLEALQRGWNCLSISF